jgi:hypothetical protein
MAGRGRAPKLKDQRRNPVVPQRGDWVQLPTLEAQVLPGLPERSAIEGPWSERTVRAWGAWSMDPASVMYGPAEVQHALDLAYVYEQWVRDGTAALASEIRQRLDVLGLSPKGKQDRRWLPPSAVEVAEKSQPRQAQVRQLRAV